MTDNKEKATILIVDDNPTNLGVLFEYLRDSGFRVLVAEDGESALKRVSYARPDVILLDVLMPGIDGFETCRRLKEDETVRDIPVIFMTALSDTLDKVKGLAIGAVDYITKPVQVEEVLARINTHLTIRELQNKLQQQIIERDELIAELDAYVHTVAHDLKDPLGNVVGYASFLQESWDTMPLEEIQKFLEVIMQTGHEMGNIIDELLLLASIRQEEAKMNPLDMADIVARVQRRLAYMIEDYQAELIVPPDWPLALGYAPWIEEVWANYASNAIKYGGQPPRVELGATVQADGSVRFWVRDNGSGLTPEERARLFTPFTRLDQVRAEGHGLGLSIVQRIMEKLRGQVGVESEIGQGSVFYFILPGVGSYKTDIVVNNNS